MVADILLALAERCETATGPDRELDVAIGLTGKFYVAEPRYPSAEPMIGYVDEDGVRVEPGNGEQDRLVPCYTASIEAALTLIPSPAEYPGSKTFLIDCATQTSVYSQPVAYVWNDKGKHMGKGHTPALALCAAALRARAAQAIDARSAGTVGSGPKGESAVP
jgi:hypothetical protein